MHFNITCGGKNNCKNNQERWKNPTQQISNTLKFLIQSFTRYFVVHQIWALENTTTKKKHMILGGFA